MDYLMEPYHGGALILFVDSPGDVQLLEIGHSKPDHPPCVLCRDRFCLHFVLAGSCEFNARTVHAGEAFLMPPRVDNRFIPHEGYEHIWIAFQGVQAQEYMRNTQIPLDGSAFSYTAFSLRPELERLQKLFVPGCAGVFFEAKSVLFSIMAKCSAPKNERILATNYIALAEQFLNTFYQSKITSADVARSIGISQKHLCRIYKQQTGETVQATLCRLRLEAAEQLLMTVDYSVAEIAARIGFDDPFYFSRFIKKMTGKTITELRKSLNGWRSR